MDGLGRSQTYHFENLVGVLKVGEINGDPCASCSGNIQNTTYDANGYVASRTDFNGNHTTYTNSASGLELSRTEAVGAPQERTIITEWHSTFRLPIKITEPGKITTFSYDSQGRLLERREKSEPLSPAPIIDTDSDGIENSADTDNDNDGVLDANDVFPLDINESSDMDGDGIGDNSDTDRDGVENSQDDFPDDSTETVDTDSDGIGNNADTDDDNDGVVDASDAFPLDSNETTDTDLDGVGNNTDADDDNDGVLDVSDVFPLDINESSDMDGDGIGDNSDVDRGGDGVDNSLDAFPNDPAETTDTDGDNVDADDDNDGVDDVYETQVGTNPLDLNDLPEDQDSNGIPDSLNIEQATSRTYNAFGRIATIDGPRTDVNDITNFDYDASGSLIKITNALSQETNITAHDAHGRPLTIVDANNVTTSLSYDARGRLLTRTIDSQVTTFEYDDVGNITKTILPNSSFLINEYDVAQRLVAVEDNLGNRIEFTLDSLGNRIQEDVRDPQGTLARTLSRTYNSLNRLIQLTSGENQITTFGYDANGNQTSIIVDPVSLDPAGLNQETVQDFDALNRLNTLTDADNGITIYVYDDRDNLSSVTDPAGLTTTYTYDALDNLLTKNSPDTGLSSFNYDNAGNRIQQRDAGGIITNFTCDTLNRVTNINYPDNSQNITFIYDTGVGCSNGIGRLCQMQDASGSTNFSYDARGNLSSQTRTIDSVTTTISYTYDGADQITQIIYPSGRIVDYNRNALGQIDSVSTTHNSQTTVLSSVHIYESFGPMNAMSYGNGLSHTRQYDLEYRLTQLTTMNGSIHQDISYVFDEANNITAITNNMDATRNQAFQYDNLNRSADATGIYGDLDYSYDANGNRVSEELNSNGPKTYSYNTDHPTDPSHHLLQTQNGGIIAYQYDNNGNTLDNTGYQFSYGDNNRLQTATK